MAFKAADLTTASSLEPKKLLGSLYREGEEPSALFGELGHSSKEKLCCD
jgi:hypothetical protein